MTDTTPPADTAPEDVRSSTTAVPVATASVRYDAERQRLVFTLPPEATHD
ncbi:hypothetical protein [Clavibacter zhangzhiyongii]